MHAQWEEKLTRKDSNRIKRDKHLYVYAWQGSREGDIQDLKTANKTYMEKKPSECFKVKALYPGYNYLQNTSAFIDEIDTFDDKC